jgi:hypothetical protein
MLRMLAGLHIDPDWSRQPNVEVIRVRNHAELGLLDVIVLAVLIG